jgi:hypothetical protein
MVVVDDRTLNLIKNGHSINEIVKITGLGKSTIYFHYKKLKGRKNKKIEFKFKSDNEIGEFLGIFAGDGSYSKDKKKYHHCIRIYTGYYEREYAKKVYNNFSLWFNKKPMNYILKFKGRPTVVVNSYYSKELLILIQKYLKWEGKKTYSVELRDLNLKNKQFNIGFIRGLIDTDGSLDRKRNRLSFSTVSTVLVKQAERIIESLLGKRPKHYIIIDKRGIRKDLHIITVHGKNAKDLIDIIKPNNDNKRL